MDLTMQSKQEIKMHNDFSRNEVRLIKLKISDTIINQ